ncbi:MAG: DUF2087 domain-containing protein [Actinobacteria bacterium]|nr:DUF2087 domain-containing protein [Actinomycetota bacterium]
MRLTLDTDRLAVLGQLATGPATAAEVAAATGLTERSVLSALGTLAAAEFVQRHGTRYRLEADRLRTLASQLQPAADVDASVLKGMTTDEGVVLARFFSGERLTQIPLARSKRRVVLERLSLDFEPGVSYPESAVNEILSRRHPDYAALRRYLVDEGYLDRRAGVYRRSGGRVDTTPA